MVIVAFVFVVGEYVPIGNTELQPAFVPVSSLKSQPSNALGPLNDHSEASKVALGPAPSFLYAQPSKCSQASPVPSTPISPIESSTAPFL